MSATARCPVCRAQLPAHGRRGGRKPRYCSSACKAKAYRARQRSAPHASAAEIVIPADVAGRHACALEVRQQISELADALADAASGQQALFPSARARPSDTAAALHQLIGELAALAAAPPVTSRHETPPRVGGAPRTAPLFQMPGTRAGRRRSPGKTREAI